MRMGLRPKGRLLELSLGQVGPAAKAAVKDLGQALQADNVLLRRAAADALVHLGPAAQAAAGALRQALNDPDEDVREHAAEALKNLKRMQSMGWVGAYGFYEAGDYQKSLKKPELVREWMAHHQGMSLLADGAGGAAWISRQARRPTRPMPATGVHACRPPARRFRWRSRGARPRRTAKALRSSSTSTPAPAPRPISSVCGRSSSIPTCVNGAPTTCTAGGSKDP